MTDRTYRCPGCGWTGTEDQMEADASGGSADETWSNWICPQCQTWWRLVNHEVVDAPTPPRPPRDPIGDTDYDGPLHDVL